jgi:hypothetical protein
MISLSSLIPQPTVDDRAIGLFVSQYVLGNSRAFGYLDIFYAMPNMDDHLSACIRAVSLASFAEEARSTDLSRKAWLQYGSSLRLTNLALQSPKLATKDSTLLAIFLLDLFEKITAKEDLRSMASITEHVKGASKLVYLRGTKQFSSPIGLRMFMQLSSMLMISSALCRTRLPEEFIVLRKYIKRFFNASDPLWLVLEQMVRYVGLLADIKEGILSDPREIMAAAMEQDDQCASLSKTMASRWPYEIVFTNDTVAAYEGVYHEYSIDYNVLRTWNSLRGGRILLNEIIREQYFVGCLTFPLFDSIEHRLWFQLATDNIADISSEICGCIPQFCTAMPRLSTAHESPIGWPASPSSFSSGSETADQRSPASPSSSSSGSETSDQKFTYIEQASAYSLIYSLYVIGRSPGSPEKLRHWAIDRLCYIGYYFGLKDALMVADLLEQHADLDPWLVCRRLGIFNIPM